MKHFYQKSIASPRSQRTNRQCDNHNLRKHKYVYITTYQPDTKSNPNHNLNPITTKQHAVVNSQLNIVACPTYPDKFIRDMLLHRLH